MRINDFHNILELIKQDILHSEAEYLKLLKVVGNNQRYDFRSQLSIYDKNPEATACAKFDYWRERFHRTVMRGQKGIPILEDYGTYKKVDYIFDVSPLQLDLDVDAARQFQTAQCVNGFCGRSDDLDQTLMCSDFKLFTRVLVLVDSS